MVCYIYFKFIIQNAIFLIKILGNSISKTIDGFEQK